MSNCECSKDTWKNVTSVSGYRVWYLRSTKLIIFLGLLYPRLPLVPFMWQGLYQLFLCIHSLYFSHNVSCEIQTHDYKIAFLYSFNALCCDVNPVNSKFVIPDFFMFAHSWYSFSILVTLNFQNHYFFVYITELCYGFCSTLKLYFFK